VTSAATSGAPSNSFTAQPLLTSAGNQRTAGRGQVTKQSSPNPGVADLPIGERAPAGPTSFQELVHSFREAAGEPTLTGDPSLPSGAVPPAGSSSKGKAGDTRRTLTAWAAPQESLPEGARPTLPDGPGGVDELLGNGAKNPGRIQARLTLPAAGKTGSGDTSVTQTLPVFVPALNLPASPLSFGLSDPSFAGPQDSDRVEAKLTAPIERITLPDVALEIRLRPEGTEPVQLPTAGGTADGSLPDQPKATSSPTQGLPSGALPVPAGDTRRSDTNDRNANTGKESAEATLAQERKAEARPEHAVPGEQVKAASPSPASQPDGADTSAQSATLFSANHSPGASLAVPVEQKAAPEVPATTQRQQAAPTTPHTTHEPTLTNSETGQTLRLVSLEFTPDGASDVRLRLSERAGEVHISLHSSDPSLSGRLHEGIHDLVGSLSTAGYDAEAWTPSQGRQNQRQQDDSPKRRREDKSGSGGEVFNGILQQPVREIS
jgi:hypothetical protein